MNRNVESHFSKIPTASIQRSSFDTSAETVTTLNAGELVPLLVKEVYPGDTFSITSSKIVRAQTLLAPIFGNMYLDTYWFYVPNRLVWEHWAEFTGESKDSPWISPTQYNLPRISSPDGGWCSGTIADYMGIPVNTKMTNSKHIPQALPFRGYAMICNEFFRDENLSDPLNIPTGDANQTGSNGDDYVNDVANGGMPFKVAKYHDYFSSCLPDVHRGSSVDVPVNVIYNEDGRLPVSTYPQAIPSELWRAKDTGSSGNFFGLNPQARNSVSAPMWFGLSGMTDDGDAARNNNVFAQLRVNSEMTSTSSNQAVQLVGNGAQAYSATTGYTPTSSQPEPSPFSTSSPYWYNNDPTVSWSSAEIHNPDMGYGWNPKHDATMFNGYPAAVPINLWTGKLGDYMGLEGTSFDINGLRLAYATQRYLENSARGGNRMRESLLCHFGVRSPDARLDVPEYLGGNRVSIDVREVTNNAQTDSEFLGDLGAVSRTADVHADFTKSFTEHGFLFCLACIRYDHVYSQGLERFWMRDDYLSFYTPEFANIGEQPVWSDELYYDDDNEENVFGYQEAWADLRYGVNHMTSEMRVSADQPFNSWHLGDYYDTCPTLSDEWIREDKSNIDRVLAVQSSQAKQFFGDFYFKINAVRPMPMFSIPKLGNNL